MIRTFLLGFVVALLLSSCSILDKFNDSQFNQSEYDQLVTVKWVAEQGDNACKQKASTVATLTELEVRLNQLMIWEKYTNRSLSLKLVTPAHDMVASTLTTYAAEATPSETYCKAKFVNINKVLDIVLKSASHKTQK
jgi:hypothetical protein